MDDTKNEATPQQNVEKRESTEQGRVETNAPKTAGEKDADISQVDQQEGQMNNGELGGNFEIATDEATK
ncbi:MAG TPA: hypothetical protein VM010_07555 [Chitinophagaceae bacterium]|nr:hypothetical protein [Chitinophagaceae bacterium]